MAYGTVQLDTLQSSSPLTPTTFVDSNGTQVGTLCRAWLNMNNTSGATVIRSSFNVSSVTYIAAGNFTVNFTNAFSDTNYCTVTSSGVRSGTSVDGWLGVRITNTPSYSTKTTTACEFFLLAGNNAALLNNFDNNIAFFR